MSSSYFLSVFICLVPVKHFDHLLKSFLLCFLWNIVSVVSGSMSLRPHGVHVQESHLILELVQCFDGLNREMVTSLNY